MASWRILSCASDSTLYPMRLAGTCSRYSNRAMPQLTTAARYHGRSARFWRCAYHANVMNTFEQSSSSAAWTMTSVLIGPPGTKLGIHGAPDPRHQFGNGGHVGVGGAEVDDAGAEQEAAVEHRIGHEHLAAQLQSCEQRLVEGIEVILGL